VIRLGAPGREAVVSQNREELPRQAWHDFFELLTKEHEASEVVIEVVSLDFGDQVEAERLPLSYIEYDHKDDVFIVGVGGKDSRYPVVLDHIVPHPERILVDSTIATMAMAIDVIDSDGRQTIITLRRVPALPAETEADHG
jgi:hypothetical protein